MIPLIVVAVGAVGAVAGYAVQKGGEKIYDVYRKMQEKKTTKAIERKIDGCFQELQKKKEALQEYSIILQTSRQRERQLLIADLEKNQGTKEKNLARVMLSRIEEEKWQLLQKIQILDQVVQKWPETTKDELHLLRADLDKNQGKKEEEISRALECRVNQKFQQLFQEIESLEKYFQKLLKSSQNDLQLLGTH